MKKYIALCTVMVLLFILTACHDLPALTSSFEKEIETIAATGGNAYEAFSVEEYKEKIEIFSSDKKVEPIKSAVHAKEAALYLLMETFGEEILNRPSYLAFYDEENDTWLVRSTLPEDTVGGNYHLIVTTDGNVLALWGEK